MQYNTDNYSKAKILVVDDMQENLHAMKRLLQDLPVEAHFSNCGRDALEKLIRNDYALAILDVQMPEIDGYELAELMTSNAATEYIPIIFVTAISKEERHIVQGYHSGCVDYLCKPFEPEHLIAKVEVFVKLYQERLNTRRQKQLLTTILNEVVDGWWEWQVGTNHQYFSESIKSALGYLDHELSNKTSTFQELVHPDDLPKAEQVLTEHLETQKPYQISLRFRHKSGAIKWLFCRGVSIHNADADESHPRMITTCTDITPIKDIEAQLLRSNKELEQFAYIASHDLRAPLRGISNVLTWIKEDHIDELSDECNELFSKLNGRVERMDNLITGILEFSRVGRITPELTTVDLNTVLRDAIDLLSPQGNVNISIKTPLPTLHVPAVQIKQVFSNLLSNAIKYNDKDNIEITIDCQAMESHFEFTVKDNGPGIDIDFTDKVFQIFQTLQPRDVIESTGIGLSITKKIIELYGGKIWFTSDLGQETCFHFTWPK